MALPNYSVTIGATVWTPTGDGTRVKRIHLHLAKNKATLATVVIADPSNAVAIAEGDNFFVELESARPTIGSGATTRYFYGVVTAWTRADGEVVVEGRDYIYRRMDTVREQLQYATSFGVESLIAINRSASGYVYSTVAQTTAVFPLSLAATLTAEHQGVSEDQASPPSNPIYNKPFSSTTADERFAIQFRSQTPRLSRFVLNMQNASGSSLGFTWEIYRDDAGGGRPPNPMAAAVRIATGTFTLAAWAGEMVSITVDQNLCRGQLYWLVIFRTNTASTAMYAVAGTDTGASTRALYPYRMANGVGTDPTGASWTIYNAGTASTSKTIIYQFQSFWRDYQESENEIRVRRWQSGRFGFNSATDVIWGATQGGPPEVGASRAFLIYFYGSQLVQTLISNIATRASWVAADIDIPSVSPPVDFVDATLAYFEVNGETYLEAMRRLARFNWQGTTRRGRFFAEWDGTNIKFRARAERLTTDAAARTFSIGADTTVDDDVRIISRSWERRIYGVFNQVKVIGGEVEGIPIIAVRRNATLSAVRREEKVIRDASLKSMAECISRATGELALANVTTYRGRMKVTDIFPELIGHFSQGSYNPVVTINDSENGITAQNFVVEEAKVTVDEAGPVTELTLTQPEYELLVSMDEDKNVLRRDTTRDIDINKWRFFHVAVTATGTPAFMSVQNTAGTELTCLDAAVFAQASGGNFRPEVSNESGGVSHGVLWPWTAETGTGLADRVGQLQLLNAAGTVLGTYTLAPEERFWLHRGQGLIVEWDRN